MNAPLTTRILLADDHPVVLRGLRMVLDAQPDLTVVGEAGDAPDLAAPEEPKPRASKKGMHGHA